MLVIECNDSFLFFRLMMLIMMIRWIHWNNQERLNHHHHQRPHNYYSNDNNNNVNLVPGVNQSSTRRQHSFLSFFVRSFYVFVCIKQYGHISFSAMKKLFVFRFVFFCFLCNMKHVPNWPKDRKRMKKLFCFLEKQWREIKSLLTTTV